MSKHVAIMTLYTNCCVLSVSCQSTSTSRGTHGSIAITTVDNLPILQEAATRPNFKCRPDRRPRSDGCEIHSLAEWRFSCAFLHAIFRAHLATHARTHAHKRRERVGLNRWNYTASHITQSKQDCVRCTASLTKAFFTVKMSHGLTAHASAYFHLCP